MKIGPKYKICRRLGSRVFGKCETTKFSISGAPVGQKGGKGSAKRGRPKALSEYGSQLLEKQKARYAYGLKAHQFANYVKALRAHSAKNSTPVTQLYQSLESRLDNVVFRLGIAKTRLAARQLVSHGHITVNGRKLNIPSYRVQVGETVAIRPGSRERGVFKNLDERLKDYREPEWLLFDLAKREGVVKALPQTGAADLDINFGAILEFYSRV